MRDNSYYTLFTKKQIPDDDERRAVNCYYADLVICDDRLSYKCKKDSYNLWIRCPKQTKKRYKGESSD